MQALFNLPGTATEAWLEALATAAMGPDALERPHLMPTPRDTIARDGAAQLYRFRRPEGAPAAPRMPLLVVPSMINRWFVVDLRKGASLVEALTRGGVDTFCLDWGVPRDEDRHLAWDEVIDRLARAVRMVRRTTGAPRVGVLGYCMGATLSAIYTALQPETVCALVNLAGPIDFAHAGLLGHMTRPQWFDPEAITAAGNLAPAQMQSGFVALRPTAQFAKMVALAERGGDKSARESFGALEAWANDNIPFPAAAYVTYIRELYQQNLLVKGEHHVRGRRVDLGQIRCPVLTVTADRDAICPPAAAHGLDTHCGSTDQQRLAVPGGHVGAVVGSKASTVLYPAMVRWLRERLDVASHTAAPAETPPSRL